MRPFPRTYSTKVAPLPRKAATCSCRGLVSISRRAPAAALAASERGERGWAKLYLTCRVKGRSPARARVPDYGARTWFSIRRHRMSVIGFAEMCTVPRRVEEVCARGSGRAFSRRESRGPIHDSEESSWKRLLRERTFVLQVSQRSCDFSWFCGI